MNLIWKVVAADQVDIVSSTVDISQEEQVQTFIDQAVEKLGRIDYAVNAAGASLLYQKDSQHTLIPSRHLEQQ